MNKNLLRGIIAGCISFLLEIETAIFLYRNFYSQFDIDSIAAKIILAACHSFIIWFVILAVLFVLILLVYVMVYKTKEKEEEKDMTI